MSDNDGKNTDFGRREVLKLSASATLATTGATASALANGTKVPSNFIAGSPANPITTKAIDGIRRSLLAKHGLSEVPLSGNPVESNEEVYGYAIRLEEKDGKSYPVEYIEAVPSGFSLERRKALARHIRERVKAIANGDALPNDPYVNRTNEGPSTAGFSLGSSPYSTSDGSHTNYDSTVWSTEGEIHKATYVEKQYYDCGQQKTDTVGRMDLDLPVYRNDSESTSREEWACVVELEQWPGVYLESYDDAVGSNANAWRNSAAKTRQHWTSGNMGPYELHDMSPTGENTDNYDGSVTFGVSAEKTAYAEVTIEPDGSKIHYKETSDPGDSVETNWSFRNSATDNHVVVGNAGACWSDYAETSRRTLLHAEVWSEFSASVDVLTDYGCTATTKTGSNWINQDVIIGEI